MWGKLENEKKGKKEINNQNLSQISTLTMSLYIFVVISLLTNSKNYSTQKTNTFKGKFMKVIIA